VQRAIDEGQANRDEEVDISLDAILSDPDFADALANHLEDVGVQRLPNADGRKIGVVGELSAISLSTTEVLKSDAEHDVGSLEGIASWPTALSCNHAVSDDWTTLGAGSAYDANTAIENAKEDAKKSGRAQQRIFVKSYRCETSCPMDVDTPEPTAEGSLNWASWLSRYFGYLGNYHASATASAEATVTCTKTAALLRSKEDVPQVTLR